MGEWMYRMESERVHVMLCVVGLQRTRCATSHNHSIFLCFRINIRVSTANIFLATRCGSLICFSRASKYNRSLICCGEMRWITQKQRRQQQTIQCNKQTTQRHTTKLRNADYMHCNSSSSSIIGMPIYVQCIYYMCKCTFIYKTKNIYK